VPLWSLLPKVVASTDAPVLAAGGLVDGRDLATALRAGGQGVVIGTAFLASPEFFAHEYHKQRIVHARPGDTPELRRHRGLRFC
jgi:nitronate monooxygenase